VTPRDHVVHLYRDDDELVAAVSSYVIDAIRAGDVVVAVATPQHVDCLQAALSAAGIDLDAACDTGNVILLDAAETLSRFSVNGWPDGPAFHVEVGGVIEQAAKSGQPVRVFGEMVALLWDAGHVGAAIELESLWNDLAHEMTFSLFCAYAARSVASDEQRPDLAHVCRLHSEVVGAAETTRTFAPVPEAAGAARRFVVDWLETWGLHQAIDDASLVTAELASNAVVHACSPFTVAVSAQQDVVRIAVLDHSPVLPASRAASPTAISGRGLGLIARLARRWGTDRLGTGKVIWVELAR